MLWFRIKKQNISPDLLQCLFYLLITFKVKTLVKVTQNILDIYSFWFQLRLNYDFQLDHYRLSLLNFAARPEAGSENVILRSETGVYLGQTEIEYYDEVERSIEFLVRDSKNHPRLLRALASASESSAGDGQISASCGEFTYAVN